MKQVISTLCAAALAVSVAVVGAFPASAAPIYTPRAQTAEQTDVVQVAQPWKRRIHRGPGRHSGPGKFYKRSGKGHYSGLGKYGGYGGKNYYGKRYPRGFYKHNNYAWYNGHRGYRNWHDGYRHYNGWWFPAGAFIAGAIISGAIANDYYVYDGYGGGTAHVQWCYDRYRSYREWDNSWQPYHGPRRQCISPYM